MSDKNLMDVIEDLLNESIADDINKITADNQKKKPEHSSSPDTQGILGSETGAAMDAGGDKDVGGMEKGKFASDASADTQGILGTTSGAALDAGGDKDVGKIDGKTAQPSGASAEVEADKGPHDQANDPGLKEEEEVSEEEAEAVVEEEAEESVEEEAEAVVEEEAEESVEEEAEESDEVIAENGDEDDDEDDDDEDDDDEKEMDEDTDLEEKLHGDQHKLDHNDNGKVDGGDMKMVRKKGATAHLNKEEVEGETLKKVSGEANREHRPEHEKGDNAPKTKQEPFAAGDHSPHDQANDPHETATKANPKGEAASKSTAGGKVASVSEESDDDLNEDFKARAAVIFEATVNEKVSMVKEELEAEFETAINEEKETLNAKVAEYMEEAVQEWLQENALEVKYSLRTEIAENFIRGLKGLFEESYVEIPEEDISVVDELTEAVESYKEQLEETTAKLAELQMFELATQRKDILSAVTEDLTQTQAARLEQLADNLDAADINEFGNKVKALKEGYFGAESDQPLIGSLTEEVMTGQPVDLQEDDSSISQYAKFLSKTVLK